MNDRGSNRVKLAKQRKRRKTARPREMRVMSDSVRLGDGVLVYPGQEPHRCEAPNWQDVKQHALWQCDCGKRWSLEYCDWHRVRNFLGFEWLSAEVTGGSVPSLDEFAPRGTTPRLTAEDVRNMEEDASEYPDSEPTAAFTPGFDPIMPFSPEEIDAMDAAKPDPLIRTEVALGEAHRELRVVSHQLSRSREEVGRLREREVETLRVFRDVLKFVDKSVDHVAGSNWPACVRRGWRMVARVGKDAVNE